LIRCREKVVGGERKIARRWKQRLVPHFVRPTLLRKVVEPISPTTGDEPRVVIVTYAGIPGMPRSVVSPGGKSDH